MHDYLVSAPYDPARVLGSPRRTRDASDRLDDPPGQFSPVLPVSCLLLRERGTLSLGGCLSLDPVGGGTRRGDVVAGVCGLEHGGAMGLVAERRHRGLLLLLLRPAEDALVLGECFPDGGHGSTSGRWWTSDHRDREAGGAGKHVLGTAGERRGGPCCRPGSHGCTVNEQHKDFRRCGGGGGK